LAKKAAIKMNTRFLASLLGGLSRRNTPEEEARIGAQVPTNMMLPVVNKPKLSNEALAVLRENDPTTIGRFGLREPIMASNVVQDDIIDLDASAKPVTDNINPVNNNNIKPVTGTLLSGASSRPKFASNNVPIPRLSLVNEKMREPTEEEELLLDKQGFNAPEGELTIPEGRGVLQDSLNNAVEVPFGEQEKPKTIQEQLDELRGKINKKYESPGTTMGDRLQLLGGVLSDNFGIPGENRNRLQQVQSAIQGRRAADREQFLDERGLLTTEANRLQGQLDLTDERQREDFKDKERFLRELDLLHKKQEFEAGKNKEMREHDKELLKIKHGYDRTLEEIEYSNSLKNATVPLTVDQEAFKKEIGKKAAQAKAGLPALQGYRDNVDNVIRTLIKTADENPGVLESTTGILQGGSELLDTATSQYNRFTGSANLDAIKVMRSIYKQLDGQVFTTGFKQIAGQGSTSDTEAAAAEAAQARFKAARKSGNPNDMLQALQEFQNVINSSYERNAALANSIKGV
jgi:hypothetical protein